MTTFSDDYNELPFETRVIAGRVINQTRINQIRIDQQKAKSAYQKFMRETKAQIHNLEQELATPPAGLPAKEGEVDA